MSLQKATCELQNRDTQAYLHTDNSQMGITLNSRPISPKPFHHLRWDLQLESQMQSVQYNSQTCSLTVSSCQRMEPPALQLVKSQSWLIFLSLLSLSCATSNPSSNPVPLPLNISRVTSIPTSLSQAPSSNFLQWPSKCLLIPSLPPLQIICIRAASVILFKPKS